MPSVVTLITLLRPQQWLKNLMLFFPPFLDGTLLQPTVWQKGILPFIAFSLASSGGYILNDLMDRETDRNHPTKANRPLASGRISTSSATAIAAVLILSALVMTFWHKQISLAFILLAYLAVTIAYSCCLKNIPVIDLFCIATGFLFRLQAGGAVFEVTISQWLFLSVLLLSLFLSSGKRLSEKLTLLDEAASHRKVLAHYPEGFLDGVLFMTGSAVLVTYTMYTLSHRMLLYSVPLCCFGLLRYILRVKSGLGGDPTEALLRDPWLFAVGMGWCLMIGWGIYIP
ncbi:MAG: decaprenyl-phosphate phosphoribosyltransferase [Desulfobacter sp.]